MVVRDGDDGEQTSASVSSGVVQIGILITVLVLGLMKIHQEKQLVFPQVDLLIYLIVMHQILQSEHIHLQLC